MTDLLPGTEATARGLRWELVYTQNLAHTGHANINPKQIAGVFSSQSRFDTIWQAATVKPLAPRAVAHIKELPKILEKLGVNFTPPHWWDEIMSTLIVPAPTENPNNTPAPGPSAEEDSS